MSDDPREATAGGGMSAERRERLRDTICGLIGPGDEYADYPTGQVEITYRELRALLDAHGALQAAREQLDEARRDQ